MPVGRLYEAPRLNSGYVMNSPFLMSPHSPQPVSTSKPISRSIPITIVKNGDNGASSDSHNGSSRGTPPPKTVAAPKPTFQHGGAEHAKGLKNLGNTCFMNSIVQCLVHTRKLLDFCQNNELTSVNNNRKCPITKAFVNLAQDMWRKDGSISDPSGFKREMGRFASMFLGFDQHDSQEFLQYALEGLHTELNRVEPTKKRPTPEPEDPSLSAREQGRKALAQYLKRDDSYVTDLFLGQFRSTLKCSECDHESVTFEPFWVVSLPIPGKKVDPSLEDCLDLFMKEETLDGDEKPTCESCKERTKCTKWYRIERWPEILVIHLKRFAPTERFRSKLTSHVDVKVEDLDLSSYSSSGSSAVYNCYGVSNHSGTLHGGHYTCACRHPYNRNDWFLYNDTRVHSTRKTGLISNEAYLLFFEKASDADEEEEENAEEEESGGDEEW